MLQAVSKFWLPAHRRCERFCILAVTGQLGCAQMCELNEHIATCDSCREFLGSVTQVSVQAMSLLAEKHAPAADIVPPEGMRARFLSGLAAEVLNAKADETPRPQLVVLEEPSAMPGSERARVKEAVGSGEKLAGTGSGLFPLMWRPATALAVCAVMGTTGFFLGKRITARTPKQVAQTVPSSTPPSQGTAPADATDHLSALERQKAALEGDLSNLKQKLSVVRTEQESLRVELATARDKLAAFATQARSASQRSLVEGQEAKNQLATLQSQVDRLNQRLAESAVKLGVQKQTTEELTAKLEATEADLQRESDVKSAKNEIGDLVAARNLHIVDVYDANSKGKRQPAFGRVFYIEGKSLVFYAYDLEDPRRFNANVVFHVWGEKAGIKDTTHSLGILHNDDASQGCWTVTFDDLKVLAQINSVFVTAEVANKHYDGPHGKKVLYAYFGSPPNHP